MGFGYKKEFTSVGVGVFDKGAFHVGNIPLERFGEFAKVFKDAKEKGLGVAVFVKDNMKKKSDKSPDVWVNFDVAKPYKGGQKIADASEDEF